MTDNTARNDSFISMVLDISGRVRPSDLNGVPQSERKSAIESFGARHGGTMELHFEGDALVKGPASSAVASFADEPAAAVPPVAGTPPAEDSMHRSPEPPPGLAFGMGATEEELALIGDAPEPSEFKPIETPPIASPGSGAQNQPAVGVGSPAVRREPAKHAGPRTWMVWWVPTLVVPILGGVLAWAANKREREGQARAMLIVGLLIGAAATLAFAMYADQLANLVLQTKSGTVIVIPSTQVAPSTPGSASPTNGGSTGSQ